MTKHIIRAARIEDMEQVNRAHVRSIREVCSKDYSPEQIQKWSSIKYSEDLWSKTVNDDYCYVIEKDSEVQGVCHASLRNDGMGEITGMYFTPELVGQGFGRKLIEKCIAELKQAGIKKIVLRGTKTARGFYEAVGFKLIEEKMILIRGAELESFYMEYEV